MEMQQISFTQCSLIHSVQDFPAVLRVSDEGQLHPPSIEVHTKPYDDQ